MSILVENITKIYGKQKALDNVSFEVKKGEVVGLLGPNGAGKSTMMKILTCFLPPNDGNAKVCGFDIFEQSIEVRKKVGYLPEHNPLYLDMYVKEYLDFIANIYKVQNRKQRVSEMVEVTGLQLEQNKKIGALSKGYRQRVGLASAMIHNPEVLILDEPTSGLDPNQLVDIRNLISKLGKEKTVMLSTHIMQEVEAVCNRVIIIDRGIIVTDKPTSELHKTGSKQFIKVEFAGNVEERELKNIKNISSVKKIANNTWMFTSTNPSDVRPDIFQFAVNKGLTVLSMQLEEETLEKVFQELTRK